MHQAGDSGRKLRRHKCGVCNGFRQFKHKVDVAAPRGIFQPRTKYTDASMGSGNFKGKLADGSGLVVGQAHGKLPVKIQE